MNPEPERHELSETPRYRFDVDRRQFLQIAGTGIAVFVVLDDTASAQFGAAPPAELSAWLHIDGSGQVTAYTGKVEVGQNTRTSLTQAVADELRLSPGNVTLIMGDTDRTPFDIGTFGSLSTPVMAPQLRRAAATARELLVDLASERLGVERSGLVLGDGRISDPMTGRSLGFGELTQGKKLTKTIADAAPVTSRDGWTVAGTSVPKVGARDFVTGRHTFTSDLSLPGMLVGKVLRPPSLDAALVSLDVTEARAMKDVVVVHDGDFVGVAAPNEALASRAIASMQPRWQPASKPSSAEIFDYLKSHPAQTEGFRGPRRYAQGSIDEGIAAGEHRLEEAYTVAYIAHTPMEPRAAVAEWTDGKLTVWTGTQRPFGVRSQLMETFHLPEERVRVRVPDTGAGYGGKHTGECAIEAARLAKAAGKPVKLVWTREEEFTFAYFRPAGVIETKSSVSADGKITAWELDNYNSGASAIEGRYDLPNHRIQYHPADSPLRQGSYRALAATANHFARESHIDGLARAAKLDPIEFRRRNSTDERLLGVLEAAAERFGWNEAPKGRGIAAGFEKNSYVATCAEVAIRDDRVIVEKLVTAFDCGAIVNPDGLKHQVEGSVIMGLGGALFEAIEIADGKIANASFSRYRVPRFSDVPVLETVLLDRRDIPSAGAGETPIVCVAPAIANAIFDATGVRLHSLPLVPNGGKLPRRA